MQLPHYLGLLHRSECVLASAFREVGEAHTDEPDVRRTAEKLAAQCERHAAELEPFVDRYGEERDEEPERLHSDLFSGTRSGPLGLVRDLHDLYLMANACDIAWTMIGQAAQGAGDLELLDVVTYCEGQTVNQIKWLKTRMKQAAPQALLVAS